MMLRRAFGPTRDEITGENRRLHNEEHYHLYFSSNIFRLMNSRRMRWTGHEAPVGGRRGACRVLIWEHERKRP
jgi:hypothetical protein